MSARAWRAARRRVASSALVLSVGVACTARAPSESRIGVTSAPVVDGEVSPEGGREDAVVLMRTIVDNAETVCTASLVAQNLVITARHCVSHLVEGDFRCTVQGDLQSQDPGAGVLGMYFDASGLEFYDGKTPRQTPIAYGSQILSTLSDTICVNDLAFVVLDRSVTLPVLPLRENGRASIGEAVTLVGYGFDNAMSTGSVLDVTTQPRTHNDTLVIGDVGPSGDDGVTSAPPRSIVVNGPAGCIGDSGGPLIANATGAVLGVYSLLDGATCLANDARNLFTHVPDFGVLAAQAFQAAGATPTPEPSGAATGGSSSEPTGTAGAGTENGAGGDGGSTNVAEAGAPTAGAAPTGNDGEGGAPSMPSDGGGQSGAPDVAATSGAPSGAGVGGASRAEPTTTPHAKGGCALAPGAARAPRGAWFIALVAVFERVFRVRRRVRRRARLDGGGRARSL
ncbi:MAG TPA: trypsin-like serine protease [Polyangiaceae bacterium]|nr:trypsin-like serine protease [Polyangiaceae bacterium]